MRFTTAASLAALAMGIGLGASDTAQAGLMGQGQEEKKGPQDEKTNTQPGLTTPVPDAVVPDALVPGAQNGKTNGAAVEGQIQTQEADALLATNLRGAVVYGADETRIGDVNDLIIKPDGKVEGVVVGVGGFLGIGEKNVALKLERFKVTQEGDGRARLILNAKKEELEKAPDFKSR